MSRIVPQLAEPRKLIFFLEQKKNARNNPCIAIQEKKKQKTITESQKNTENYKNKIKRDPPRHKKDLEILGQRNVEIRNLLRARFKKLINILQARYYFLSKLRIIVAASVFILLFSPNVCLTFSEGEPKWD